jgi:hypothetical protein
MKKNLNKITVHWDPTKTPLPKEYYKWDDLQRDISNLYWGTYKQYKFIPSGQVTLVFDDKSIVKLTVIVSDKDRHYNPEYKLIREYLTDSLDPKKYSLTFKQIFHEIS